MAEGDRARSDSQVVKLVSSRPGGGSYKGGGEPPDDMKERIEALEAGHKAILSKLDDIAKSIGDSRLDHEKRFSAIDTRLAGMDAKLDAKATKADLTPIEVKLTSVKDAVDTRAAISDLNLLTGKVNNLPTTLQLLGFIIAIFVAAGVTRYFGH